MKRNMVIIGALTASLVMSSAVTPAKAFFDPMTAIGAIQGIIWIAKEVSSWNSSGSTEAATPVTQTDPALASQYVMVDSEYGRANCSLGQTRMNGGTKEYRCTTQNNQEAWLSPSTQQGASAPQQSAATQPVSQTAQVQTVNSPYGLANCDTSQRRQNGNKYEYLCLTAQGQVWLSP